VAIEVPDAAAVAGRLRKAGIRLGARGGWLRVSPHFYTTEAEVDALFEALDKVA
jgi:selenocysteine lyase/cysteine desulfurase